MPCAVESRQTCPLMATFVLCRAAVGIKRKKEIPADLRAERILSPEVVAALDDVSVKTVRRRIKSGALRAVRLSTNRIGITESAWRAGRKAV